MGFFFPRHRAASQSEGSTNAIELADAQAKTEAFLDDLLEHGTGKRRSGLAVLNEKGSHLAAQFDRMTMPSIGERCFAMLPHCQPQSIGVRLTDR